MTRKEEHDYYNAIVTTKFTRNLYDALDLYSSDAEILLPKDIIIRLAVEEYLKKNYRKISNSDNKTVISILLKDDDSVLSDSEYKKIYDKLFGINEENESNKKFRVVS